MATGFMAGSILSKMVLNTTSWNNSIKVVKKDENTLKGMSARLAPKFKKIGAGMTIAGAGIVAGLTAGVKAFGKFDLAMTESLAIMGDVSEGMKTKMKDAALEMSGQSKFAADELAQSYFYLASAGIDAAGSIKALPVVTRFAQAGAFDLARATDLLTDAQSALGLSSKDAVKNQAEMIRVSDVLVKANTLANGTVAEFSEALTNRAGPSMRGYNIEIEDGVAVLAAFANQGVKGRDAGTQYAIVLRDLQKAAQDNAGAFKEAGVAVYDSNEKLNNMGDIVAQLEQRLEGMTDKQKKAELSTLGFQEKSQAALLTLIGTSEQIKDYGEKLREAGGITKEVSDKQLQSFSAQMLMAKNQVTKAAIAIGEQLAPSVVSIAKFVSGLVSKIADWAKENKTLFGIIVKVVAVLGVLLSTLGPIVMMIPLLVSGITAIGAALTVTAGLVGVLVIALAGLAYGIYKVVEAKKALEEATRRNDEVTKKFTDKLAIIAEQAGLTAEEYENLKKKYEGMTETREGDRYLMVKAIRTGKEGLALQESMNKTGEESIEIQKDQRETTKDYTAGIKLANDAVESLGKGLEDVLGKQEDWTEYLKSLGIKTIKETDERVSNLSTIMEKLDQAYEDGKISLEAYTEAMKEAKGEFEELSEAVVETAIPAARDFSDAWETAAADSGVSVGDFTTKVQEEADSQVGIWSGAATDVGASWDDMWSGLLSGDFTGLIDDMKTNFTEAFSDISVSFSVDFLKSIVAKTGEAIGGLVADLGGAVASVFDSFKDIGVTAITSIKDTLGSLFSGIKDTISGIATDISGSISGIFTGLKDSLTGIVGNIKGVISSIVGNIKDIGKGILKLAAGLNPGGMIATAIGTAVGTFLGSLIGPKGAGQRDTQMIKDNTWLTANVLKISVVKNLDAIKWTLWNIKPFQKQIAGNSEEMKKSLWNVNDKLGKIRKALDSPPSTGAAQTAGQTSVGTTVNINRIQNEVNLNGLMITDRDYARRLLPEILGALRQRAQKKRLQEILGIA